MALSLQRERDIENQVVAYHLEHNRPQTREVPRPVPKGLLQESEAAETLASRFAPVDLTTLQAYSEYR